MTFKLAWLGVLFAVASAAPAAAEFPEGPIRLMAPYAPGGNSDVPVQIDQLDASDGHIRGGKLRPLAVAAEKRVPELPDVPTVRELGIGGLIDPVVVKKFADLTDRAKPSTPEELAAVFDKEDRVVVPLIKKLGIKAE